MSHELPSLVDCRGLMAELNIKRGTARVLLDGTRQGPAVPANRHSYVIL
jgi:hypothetical protein